MFILLTGVQLGVICETSPQFELRKTINSPAIPQIDISRGSVMNSLDFPNYIAEAFQIQLLLFISQDEAVCASTIRVT